MATTDAPISIWSPDPGDLFKYTQQLRTMAESIHNAVKAAAPSGLIAPFAGSAAPTGWLLCEGQAVSRTTYAALFSAIGTTYGAGDGTSTFNLPNLKGRVPVGRDTAATEFNALGKTGGEKEHKLTVPEMPAHSHSLAGYGKNFTLNPGTSTTRYRLHYSGDADNATIGSEAAGGSQAHNNLQPYITVNYIIKA